MNYAMGKLPSQMGKLPSQSQSQLSNCRLNDDDASMTRTHTRFCHVAVIQRSKGLKIIDVKLSGKMTNALGNYKQKDKQKIEKQVLKRCAC